MKATTILNSLITDVTPNMHKKRRHCLAVMTRSLMSGASLTVTSLGRCLHSNTTDKHQIKRSMRLCSNHTLHQETASVYGMMARQLIGQQTQPIILVDWSDLDPRKQHFLLRASMAVEGRALTLLEEVYPLSQKEKPNVHKAFMTRLKTLLPIDCQPIVVTDAGFRGPWFKMINALGWDYVGRVRNRTFCKPVMQDDWQPIKSLYPQASGTAKDLGGYQLCRNNPINCHLVIYQGKRQGRHHWVATGDKARRSKHSRVHAEREKEPWLLATSLNATSRKFAKKIAKIYRARMQIEESFRDLKSGLNFNASDSRKREHIRVLLLIAMLAQCVLYLLGLAVKLAGKHQRYQANSLKTKSVLSYQFIGLRAFKDPCIKLSANDWQAAQLKIQQLMQGHLLV